MGSAYYDAHSLWQRIEKPLFTSITGNLRVDTCIVGAGIAGLSVAYQLIQEGQTVVVIERERIGLGETGLTSAHLSFALDEGYAQLQRMHGRDGARLAAESHSQAVDWIERVQSQENIPCEFQRVDGYLFLGENDKISHLKNELLAAMDSGLNQVRWLDHAPLDLFESGPCLHYPSQGQFHPLKYLDGLAQCVQSRGGKIFTHTEAIEVQGGANAFVKTSQGLRVDAANIVIATNIPFNNRVTLLTKNPAYRSYVIGIPVPSELVRQSLLWDTANPYHYLRFTKDPTTNEDLLLIGGADHRTGHETNPEDHIASLQKWAKQRLGVEGRVVTRWSGQVIEPIDGLAYIGHNPGDEQNIFIVTGDSGHGLTHGTIAAILISDLILGRENPWRKLYDPSRLHIRSLSAYMVDAVQATVPYSDWLSTGDVESVRQIEAGEGAVLREGLHKVAVYKDELGRLHSCSAVCTHLGGIVRWNSAEKTWDCPCHGSRFDRYGQVLNGPALIELAEEADPFETNVEGVTTSPT